MCGINGMFHFDRQRQADQPVLKAMRSVMTHRGPHDSGIFVDGNVGLGFNRLSIIDLSGGHDRRDGA